MALLDMNGIHGGYGGANILNGVSIAIEAHEIGVIVGPNGAGKSTTLKALFGLLKVSEGSVVFDGRTITNLPPERLVREGLSFVPQEFNVFPTMSVQENLEMGAYIRRDDYPPPDRPDLRLLPAAQGQAQAGRQASCRAASARWWRSAVR